MSETLYAAELPPLVVQLSAFILGSIWGSFFNVAIYRWPREMSVIHPPSRCPACETPIPPWRNIPIVSYLLQSGRAACCGARMSPRYLMVEALSGALALAVAEQYVVRAEPGTPLFAAGLQAALFFAFVGGLVIATFVDFEWMEIPDEVSIGGTALGLATAIWRPSVPLEDIVLGAGWGWLFVHLVMVWSIEKLIGERGMGEGDPKLVMYIGAFLGWRGVIFSFVMASVQGTLAWVIATLSGANIGPSAGLHEPVAADERAESVRGGDRAAAVGRDARGAGADETEGSESDAKEQEGSGRPRIPFGPFLALSAIEFLFFGEWFLERAAEMSNWIAERLAG